LELFNKNIKDYVQNHPEMLFYNSLSKEDYLTALIKQGTLPPGMIDVLKFVED
jgi:hypothetical protein